MDEVVVMPGGHGLRMDEVAGENLQRDSPPGSSITLRDNGSHPDYRGLILETEAMR